MHKLSRIFSDGSADVWTTVLVWVIVAGLCVFLANVIAAGF